MNIRQVLRYNLGEIRTLVADIIADRFELRICTLSGGDGKTYPITLPAVKKIKLTKMGSER